LQGGLRFLGGIALLSARTARAAVRHPPDLRALALQIENIGLRSTSVVLLTAVFSSMVITVQFQVQLARFGAKEWTGNAVGLTLARELGPVLTALMVTGRVGSGIAAELGSMAVTDQLNALRALGTDPVRKLALPRVIAGVIMVPILTVISDFVGIVGAWVITVTQLRVASSVYWNSVVIALYIQDIWMGLIKPVFLGFALVSIACFVGMRTTGGTQGVGRSTTQAVVAGSVAVLVLDFIITKLLISLLY
jgi:phospholipid/cholesterol/gamma-HCH transport system permease protein